MRENHKAAAAFFLSGDKKQGAKANNGLRRWSIKRMKGLICFFSYDMLIAAYSPHNSNLVYVTKYAIYQMNKAQSRTTSAQCSALQQAIKQTGKTLRFVESYAAESTIRTLFTHYRTR